MRKYLAKVCVGVLLAAALAVVVSMVGCGDDDCLSAGENCACNGDDCLSCCAGLSCSKSAGSNYSTCK